MHQISPSEALAALRAHYPYRHATYGIEGSPDYLGINVAVYFVKIWDEDEVSWEDVLFIRKNGKVTVYAEDV